MFFSKKERKNQKTHFFQNKKQKRKICFFQQKFQDHLKKQNFDE
jgi:hypothetical protein